MSAKQAQKDAEQQGDYLAFRADLRCCRGLVLRILPILTFVATAAFRGGLAHRTICCHIRLLLCHTIFAWTNPGKTCDRPYRGKDKDLIVSLYHGNALYTNFMLHISPIYRTTGCAAVSKGGTLAQAVGRRDRAGELDAIPLFGTKAGLAAVMRCSMRADGARTGRYPAMGIPRRAWRAAVLFVPFPVFARADARIFFEYP